MDKEKLIPWIERLSKAEKKERNAIVCEMAKENSLKEKEAWKLLCENGFNPKEEPQINQQNNSQPDQKSDSKKQSVILRHKTEYPHYRRAGLVLTQKAQTYDVTDEQLTILKKDSWVVVGNDKKEGAGE